MYIELESKYFRYSLYIRIIIFISSNDKDYKKSFPLIKITRTNINLYIFINI